MSTHNIRFCGKIRKIFIWIPSRQGLWYLEVIYLPINYDSKECHYDPAKDIHSSTQDIIEDNFC